MPRRTRLGVRLVDAVATGIIRFGGVSVIVAVAAIFFFIGREAWPLFTGSEATPIGQARFPGLPTETILVAGVDEYETFAYAVCSTPELRFMKFRTFEAYTNLPIAELRGRKITAAYRTPSRDVLFLGTDDGKVAVTEVKFSTQYTTNGRVVVPSLAEVTLIAIGDTSTSIEKVFGRRDQGQMLHFAALTGDGKLFVGHRSDDEGPKVEAVTGLGGRQVVGLAIDDRGRRLFATTDAGELLDWNLEVSREAPRTILKSEARRITALDLSIGENALLLGFNDGSIEQWFGVRATPDSDERTFQKIRSFESMPAEVVDIEPSGRDKGFVAASADGTLKLLFTTSERTLATLKAPGRIQAVSYGPKLTSIFAVTSDGQAAGWSIRNPHPEISGRALFGKVWYEGYDAPDYIWQSTGGSDDFESKFSLVPLIFGTVKGAFYGLLFAIPIAVTAALYTSQFMHGRLRQIVKPTVEIMAALPSVVIGFLAGLWLAPRIENHVVSLLLVIPSIPLFVLLALSLWQTVPVVLRSRLPAGVELVLVIAAVALAVTVCLRLGPAIEPTIFKAGFKQWVFDAFGQQFEQRNSIVIGFAMAFAVIPIIFTVSEDALSNVPQHFVSGSLALGASRWQTAMRVVLPTASPGIFSAVMIGFGRAVGETMIVLMATGNTPILNFSPFNGMRTMAANIAVEIPEAPVGGTLYRVLFLAAILLFAVTFAVNTVAELVRQHLREKFKAV